MPYTYNSLVAEVIDTLEDNSAEFVAALPNIISKAQTYLQRRIDSPRLNALTNVSVTAGNRVAILPTNVLVVRSVQLTVGGEIIVLNQQNTEYLTAYWPNYAATATPKYYAIPDLATVYLAPTPNTNGILTVECIPRYEILSPTTQSNWFSNFADTAFFAAAMMYANMWAKSPSDVALWKSVADEELATINNEARRARRSDTVDRSNGTPENNLGDGAV